MSLAGFVLTPGLFVEELTTGRQGVYCGLDKGSGHPLVRFDDGSLETVPLEDLTVVPE